MGKFLPGQSGNSAGRPVGSVKTDTLRNALLNHAPGILNMLVKAAKGGDIQAAKLVLDRCIPVLKPVEAPIRIDGINGLVTIIERGEATLTAIGDGNITLAEGQSMMTILASQARLIESCELLERIATLEGALQVKK